MSTKKSAWKASRHLGFSTLETGEELKKRPYGPGQHGQDRKRKPSEYGLQLLEKQKLRNLYGVSERQFRRLFLIAKKDPTVTGLAFFRILESRLDNLVYRMGFAMTRRQARQLVTHGHIAVNGRRVDIPSALIKAGDEVAVIENSRSKAYFKGMNEKLGAVTAPAWIVVNAEALSAKIDRFPTREEIDVPVVEQSIVELYSK